MHTFPKSESVLTAMLGTCNAHESKAYRISLLSLPLSFRFICNFTCFQIIEICVLFNANALKAQQCFVCNNVISPLPLKVVSINYC